MSAGHEGDDDRAFFHAAIERTYPPLSVTTGGQQTSDGDGALPPGRYLIQATTFSSTSGVCWVHVGPFEKGSPIPLAAGHGARKIPLSPGAAVAVELNVIKDYNDRIGAIMSTGTATVYVTKVSR